VTLLFGKFKAWLFITQVEALHEHLELLRNPAKTLSAPAEQNGRFTLHIDRGRSFVSRKEIE